MHHVADVKPIVSHDSYVNNTPHYRFIPVKVDAEVEQSALISRRSARNRMQEKTSRDLLSVIWMDEKPYDLISTFNRLI